MCPTPAIYQVKLESGLVTEDDMLPMSHCQVASPLWPLQAEMAMVGSQQRLLYKYIGIVTMEQEPVVDGFMASPDSIQSIHQSSSGSMPPEDAFDGSTSQTHATSNSTLLHALTGKCGHFVPNNCRGMMGHFRNNQ